MRREYIFIFCLIFSLLVEAKAEIHLQQSDPKELNGKTVPDVLLKGEVGQDVRLHKLLMSGPVILVPIYTHCTSDCPLSVSYLKDKVRGLSSSTYNVVLFSFDPKDEDRDLKSFREAYGVPPEWRMFRASKSEGLTLLDGFKFKYLEKNGKYLHPNTLVILKSNAKISDVFSGLSYTQESLSTAIKRAATLKIKSPFHLSKRNVALISIFAAILAFTFVFTRRTYF